MTDKPLRSIDHMMWDVEMPTSLVTITGMMTFKDKLDKEKLCEVINKRLLKFERFHKKIILKDNKPMWHLDEEFNLHCHLHHIALPAPGDYATQQEVISDLISEPLDYSKPLWQVHLIDNADGGSVVVWRLHHAIADGIALIRVMFSLTGASQEDSLNHELENLEKQARLASHPTFREELEHLFHMGENMYQGAKEMFKHPDELKDTLKDSWQTTKELGELFFGKNADGPAGLYKGKLSVYKKAAWTTDPLPLDVIKQTGKTYKATVNDVLLAVLTGAIRHHLVLHHMTPDEGIRVVVPVNLRGAEEPLKVNNKIGMLSLELPVHLEDPLERLHFIREKTALLKRSLEPVLVYNLLNIVADIIPKKMEQKFADVMGSKIVGVVTNVPGPRSPVYLAGAEIKDLVFWVPQTQTLGIGVSIISYNNKVYLGVVTDTKLVDDPDQIVHGFYKEFETMKNLSPVKKPSSKGRNLRRNV